MVRSISPICVLIAIGLPGGIQGGKLVAGRSWGAAAPAVFTAVALQCGRRGKAQATFGTNVVESSDPVWREGCPPFLALVVPRQDQWWRLGRRGAAVWPLPPHMVAAMHLQGP